MLVSSKTRLRYLINSMVMLGLLVVATSLLAWLTNKYSVEYDWTAVGRHTLSTASLELLAKMPEQLEVTSYARENPELRDTIRKFIGQYQRHKANIILRFVNPDAIPDEARNLGITVDGELVVRYLGRSENVKSTGEQYFTNALQKLARNQEHWLALIEGHGERKALGEANHDLGEWIKQLANQGYKAQSINLGEINAIPDNISALIIASPLVDYLPGEVNIILEYIAAGGNLLWLQEPGPLHQLAALAEELGIKFLAGTIIDIAGQMIGINDPRIVLTTKNLYSPHAITQGFEFTTLFPQANGIEVLENNQWKTQAIINSGNHTWHETGSINNEVEFNEGVDVQGSFAIGMSLERELEQQHDAGSVTIQQRVVVVGDGDFLSNTYLGNAGNNELGNRIINWLSGDDEFITIPPKVAMDTQLNIAPTTLGIIGVGFLFILPIVLFTIGITIFLRREKR